MNVLLWREFRSRIVIICDCIYQQKWNEVCKKWLVLKQELLQTFSENEKYIHLIVKCDQCIEKSNFLRLHDLLIYEIDINIAQELYGLQEEVRRFLSSDAQKKNLRVLEKRYKDIFILLSKEGWLQNVETYYTGSENIGISIREADKKFRLFSESNPWMESNELMNAKKLKKGVIGEICVLGFGGGHLVRMLGTSYPYAQIKVYLPNMDIFRTVICNILVSDVLNNENLALYYDPTCLDFLAELEKRARSKKFVYYINRQEVRACLKNNDAANVLINTIEKKFGVGYTIHKSTYDIDENNDFWEDEVGERIFKYVKDLLIK